MVMGNGNHGMLFDFYRMCCRYPWLLRLWGLSSLHLFTEDGPRRGFGGNVASLLGFKEC